MTFTVKAYALRSNALFLHCYISAKRRNMCLDPNSKPWAEAMPLALVVLFFNLDLLNPGTSPLKIFFKALQFKNI